MIELLNIDCMEYMKGVPDKYFELAIVDPPYGIGISNHRILGNPNMVAKNSFLKNPIKPKFYRASEWDNEVPDENYFDELKRVSNNQIIWGANYYLENLGSTKSFIVWDKQNSGNYADGELAWTSFDKPLKIVRWKWSGMLQKDMKNKEFRIHQTQKPVGLYKWLLHNYAKPGDKILDTHGGSMSIAIACHQMGFDLTLCEIDKDYYDAGVKRFKEQTLQGDLFKK